MARKKLKKDAALEHAILVSGGQTKLAKTLGISVQAISEWKSCPPRRALAVERATGGVVSKERLCPKVFGEPKREARAD